MPTPYIVPQSLSVSVLTYSDMEGVKLSLKHAPERVKHVALLKVNWHVNFEIVSANALDSATKPPGVSVPAFSIRQGIKCVPESV